MANTTITNLPTVNDLNGTEPLLGVQSGSSVQITTGQIAGLSKGSSTLPFPVSIGGTGDTTLTQYGLMYGNGTAAVGTVAPPSGTNYVLVGSAGSAPTWQSTIPVTAGVDSISFGTTGLTPSTAQAGVITVAGTLNAVSGGTGLSAYTIGDLLYASTSTALSTLADVATGSVLISGGVGVAPSYSSSPTISGTTTSGFFIANGAITGSLSQGAYTYGTLGYSDSNILGSFTTSVNSYDQIIVQNTNAGASASTNIIVSNNLGTANTYFGEFGMNSSGFSGTGAFNAANTVYLDATSADLAIGTTTSNAIHFVVNSGATDAATISSAGVFSLGTALAVGSGGTGAATFTANGIIYGNGTSALGVTGVGTTGQVLVATTGSAPSWGAIPSTAAVTSITFGTTGLTPSSATTGAVTVAGTLVAANGGTGQSTYVVGDLLYASTTTALSRLADVATGSVLVSGGIGVAPAWSASPTITTSLTTPLYIGGAAASSSITIQSTSGVGTTDSIIFRTGSQVQRGNIDTSGNWSIGPSGTSAAANLQTNANITGGAVAYAHLNNGVVQSGVTTAAISYYSAISQVASSTNNAAYQFYAAPSAGGAGSTLGNQFGFYAESTLGTLGAATVTNAYGFFGNIAAATGKWNLYMGGTASNYMAGSLGVGTLTVGSVAGSINAVGAITFQTTTNNQSYTTTGAGTITISSGTSGTIDNMVVGGTTAAAGTFTTVTAPTIVGGSSTSQVLTLKSTSGAGTTDSVVVKTGNNGAVTAATFNTAGVPLATNWYNTTTQTATNTATLTAAQITGPFLLSTPTAAAAYTLPLASAVDTALGTPAAGTGWEFVIFTNAAFVVTVTTNTGWTLVGTMTTGGTATSFARFRAYRTGTSAYTLYRIS